MQSILQGISSRNVCFDVTYDFSLMKTFKLNGLKRISIRKLYQIEDVVNKHKKMIKLRIKKKKAVNLRGILFSIYFYYSRSN